MFWRFLFALPVLLSLTFGANAADPAKAKNKLYVTNSDGNDVTVIDTATNKAIGHIEVGLHPHGIAVPASQEFILVTIEGTKPGQLVWIDPVTDKVTKKMDIGPEPNQLAVTPDGKIAYVPCSDGNWEVIDLAKQKVVERIFVGGRPHNTLCSPDGKRMYLGPMGAPKKVCIAEVATNKIIGDIPFSNVIRPIALTKDEKRLFVNVDGLVGIEVADIAERKMTHRVEANLTQEEKKVASRSHGILVSPNQKEVWECDVEHHAVHVYDITAETPKQITTIPMEDAVYWLTWSPDGKTAYIAVRGKDEVAVVDVETKKVLTHIPAGKVPKRLLVVTVPEKK